MREFEPGDRPEKTMVALVTAVFRGSGVIAVMAKVGAVVSIVHVPLAPVVRGSSCPTASVISALAALRVRT